ncbi:MAG: VWA domain-containing protein, partial [Myxococcota bacterium]
MIFAAATAFAALPFCLVLIGWSFWRRRAARKAAALQSAAQRWVGGTGMTRHAGRRGWVPRGAFLLGGTILVVAALARPQWGSEPEVTFDQAREVVLALDLSQSMLADDVAPSRLDRSKLLIESLLGELKGERVGLIVFSG